MPVSAEHDVLTKRIIGFAIEVHRCLGPGLLESAYEECLCFELKNASISYDRQVALPVAYKGIHLDCGYRMDVVVDGRVVIEMKTVEVLLPVHEAQMLTYPKLSGIETGLLLNFNTTLLKDGLRRMVLRKKE